MNDLSVTGRQADWLALLQKYGVDSCPMFDFRLQKTTLRVIEGSPRRAGLDYYRRIRKSTFSSEILDVALEIDRWSKSKSNIPIIVKNNVHFVSSTSLKYGANYANLLDFFGKTFLKNPIVEIGGGWGGEMLFAKLLSERIGVPNNHYFIFDLPDSFKVLAKVANYYGVNFLPLNLAETIDLPKEFSLISNGSFSEMSDPLLSKYFYKVILKARMGYSLTNFETQSLSLENGWSTFEFIHRLSASDCTVTEHPIAKCLSDFDRRANSRLISWTRG
jgi:hypothetical protein